MVLLQIFLFLCIIIIIVIAILTVITIYYIIAPNKFNTTSSIIKSKITSEITSEFQMWKSNTVLTMICFHCESQSYSSIGSCSSPPVITNISLTNNINYFYFHLFLDCCVVLYIQDLNSYCNETLHVSLGIPDSNQMWNTIFNNDKKYVYTSFLFTQTDYTTIFNNISTSIIKIINDSPSMFYGISISGNHGTGNGFIYDVTQDIIDSCFLPIVQKLGKKIDFIDLLSPCNSSIFTNMIYICPYFTYMLGSPMIIYQAPLYLH